MKRIVRLPTESVAGTQRSLAKRSRKTCSAVTSPPSPPIAPAVRSRMKAFRVRRVLKLDLERNATVFIRPPAVSAESTTSLCPLKRRRGASAGQLRCGDDSGLLERRQQRPPATGEELLRDDVRRDLRTADAILLHLNSLIEGFGRKVTSTERSKFAVKQYCRCRSALGANVVELVLSASRLGRAGRGCPA